MLPYCAVPFPAEAPTRDFGEGGRESCWGLWLGVLSHSDDSFRNSGFLWVVLGG